MNRNSVKGCMTTNIKKLKKKPARSLQEKGRTQETTVKKIICFKWIKEDMEAAVRAVIGDSESETGSSEILRAAE